MNSVSSELLAFFNIDDIGSWWPKLDSLQCSFNSNVRYEAGHYFWRGLNWHEQTKSDYLLFFFLFYRREEWLRAVKREDLLENSKVAKRLFICTRHFKEEHFMAADITKLNKVLKPNAIPFILVGDGQSKTLCLFISYQWCSWVRKSGKCDPWGK